jgi:hypothetical protein
VYRLSFEALLRQLAIEGQRTGPPLNASATSWDNDDLDRGADARGLKGVPPFSECERIIVAVASADQLTVRSSFRMPTRVARRGNQRARSSNCPDPNTQHQPGCPSPAEGLSPVFFWRCNDKIHRPLGSSVRYALDSPPSTLEIEAG